MHFDKVLSNWNQIVDSVLVPTTGRCARRSGLTCAHKIWMSLRSFFAFFVRFSVIEIESSRRSIVKMKVLFSFVVTCWNQESEQRKHSHNRVRDKILDVSNRFRYFLVCFRVS